MTSWPNYQSSSAKVTSSILEIVFLGANSMKAMVLCAFLNVQFGIIIIKINILLKI